MILSAFFSPQNWKTIKNVNICFVLLEKFNHHFEAQTLVYDFSYSPHYLHSNVARMPNDLLGNQQS